MPDRLLARQWLRWLLPVFGALMVAAFVASGLAVERQRNEAVLVNRSLCRAVNVDRDAMRQILQASMAATARFEADPVRRRIGLELLRHDLTLVEPIACSALVHP